VHFQTSHDSTVCRIGDQAKEESNGADLLLNALLRDDIDYKADMVMFICITN
jgi:hypothetical protein